MSSNADPKKQTTANIDDEEDLDDLDDVLTQFQVPPKPSTSSQQKSNVQSQTGKNSQPDPEELPADFAAELAAGMEEMFKSMALKEGTSQDAKSIPPVLEEVDNAGLSEQEKKFRQLWEQMLVDGLNGNENSDAGKELDSMLRSAFDNPAPDNSKEANKPTSSKRTEGNTLPSPDSSFQDAIRQAMDKLRSSDESVTNEINSSDPLSNLLSQLGDLSGEEAENVDGVLEEMLGAIMSKDVLYDPMKELSSQYPAYLSSHTGLSAEDRTRYEAQLRLSTQIMAVFDHPNYSNDNPAAQAEVFKMMNEMQTYGSPPAEIMGDLPEGFSPDAMANGDNCIIS